MGLLRAAAAGSAVLAATLVLAAPPSAPSASPSASSAPSADERLQKVRGRKAALEKELLRLRGQERSLLAQVEQLDMEVRLRNEQLKETQIVLKRASDDLEATTRRLAELEASVAAARPVLAARARALYKLGELSYLRLLLSVEHPSDMLRGYRFVSSLARRDRERVAVLRADLSTLDATRADLERRTRETLALRADLDRARRALDVDRQRKSALLASIVEKKETQAAFLQEIEEAERRLTALIAGLAEGDVTVPMSVDKGVLRWPVAGRVRVGFGRHKHPKFDTYTLHNGIEIEAPVDTPVAAVHEGTVAFADAFLGYGLMVILDHGQKQFTLYAHLAELRVKAGRKVAAGDVLGTIGDTSVNGPGLYFEVRAQGRPQDPMEWLAREPGRADDGR